MNLLTFNSGTIETVFLGGPLDDDHPPAVRTAIGSAISAFARLEYIVSLLGVQLNNEEASPTLYKDDPNSKFPKMLALVRKWIADHPGYTAARTDLDDFLYDELRKDAEFRNDLAHAFLYAFDPTTGAAELRSIKRTEPNVWQQRAIDTGIDEIIALRDRANIATRHFVEVADVLLCKSGTP